MKTIALILIMGIASIGLASTPSINYTKQEKVVNKVIDLIFDNKTEVLESIFASDENLDKHQLINCVKEASGKIKRKGSKKLFASRVSSITGDEAYEQTIYEYAFFYYFQGQKVFYYKINITFDHEQSRYKPSDIEFMKVKELSLNEIEVASIKAISPIARN
ncbi:MAG: hypothetical protein AAF502_10135 [Bacteroidota bacterium]